MIGLERRYRRLLRAYPVRYRRERGDEMLGTLLENTPAGRRWPTLREASALLCGGLRVRSGLNQRLTMAANVRLAVLLGVALMLLHLAAAGLRQVISSPRVPQGAGQEVAYLLLTAVVLAAAFFAPRRIAAGLACVTAALWFWWDGNHGEGALAAIVLVLLVTLLRGSQRLPRIWLYLVGAVLVLQAVSIWASPYVLARSLTTDLWWITLGCVVLWIVVDPRPAIATAAYVMFVAAEAVSPFSAQPRFSWQVAAYAGGGAIVAALALWRLYRQTLWPIKRQDRAGPDLGSLAGRWST